jgi:glycosyltransferase involved in cell wall biosynthesis
MTASASFSIIIPAYNYAHSVERAALSVCEQSYQSREILIINDGSTDATGEVIDAFAVAHTGQVRVLHQNNAGLAAVRNRGINESANDWLIFLDADDELCPDALAVLAQAIAQNPQARLIVGGHETDDGKRRGYVAPFPSAASKQQNFARYLDKKLTISNGGCAMHRSVFDTTHYDAALRHTEDMPVFAHVLANYDLACVDRPIARIYKHADSMRHDVDAAVKIGMSMESAIFDNNGLPQWAQKYRRGYRARRALSLLKLASANSRPALVRHFFYVAFCAAPLQALNPRYLRRVLRSIFSTGQAVQNHDG